MRKKVKQLLLFSIFGKTHLNDQNCSIFVLGMHQRKKIELAKLPTIKKVKFFLNKSEFSDGLHLRFGWEPPNTPHT